MTCRLLASLLFAVTACLGGCGDPTASLRAAQQEPDPPPVSGKRVFYIGLALYSETWSANDVVELADTLARTGAFTVVSSIASNFTTDHGGYPVADDATIVAMVRMAAEQATKDDLVFIDISTHGSRRILASKIGDNPPTILSGRKLARLLSPLAGHRTVIVISACYSGSLIDDLQTPDRIIITAARADRSSFGCTPGSRHTFFGQAELDAFGRPGRSLHQAVTIVREDVARMEAQRHFTPSEPQVSVGADVADLYEAPLF